MFVNEAHRQGLEHLVRFQWEFALEAFHHALVLDPDTPDILTDRGFAFVFSGEKEAALRDFSRAIELQPLNAERWLQRWFCHEFFRDEVAAKADYLRAKEIDPCVEERVENPFLTRLHHLQAWEEWTAIFPSPAVVEQFLAYLRIHPKTK